MTERLNARAGAPPPKEQQQELEHSCSYSSLHAGARDRKRALLGELRARDQYSAGKLLRMASVDAIEGAIRWYDEQLARPHSSISPGVLTNLIREGGMPGYGAKPPAETCPLQGRDAQLLKTTWEALDARLAKAIGSQWELWSEGAHLHAVGKEFVVACRSDLLSWFASRYRVIIERAAVVPVRFVVCEGAS